MSSLPEDESVYNELNHGSTSTIPIRDDDDDDDDEEDIGDNTSDEENDEPLLNTSVASNHPLAFPCTLFLV